MLLTASYMCQPYTFLYKAINDHKYVDGLQYTDMTWHLLIWRSGCFIELVPDCRVHFAESHIADFC